MVSLAEVGKRENGILLSPFPLHLSPHLYKMFDCEQEVYYVDSEFGWKAIASYSGNRENGVHRVPYFPFRSSSSKS